MSEMRKNKLTQEWVIYAVNRQKRPYEFEKKMSEKKNKATPCPFCRGNEEQTTQPVYQDREQNWSIRVFPNRFPAVERECNEEIVKEDFYDNTLAIGRHEVVVDTPNHNETIEQFSLEHLKNVLTVLQDRFLSIKQTEGIKQVQIFKNAGADAGMSIKHSHWQLVGLPVVSKRQLTYENASKEYQKQHGSCMICDMILWEKEQKSRVCCETEKFIAIAPYASRFSYEVWLIPKRHIASFGELTQEEIEDLAVVMKKMLKRITELRDDISYNICFVEGSTEQVDSDKKSLHCAMQILPRIGGFAGLEFGAETYINSVLPETAAKWYRGEE